MKSAALRCDLVRDEAFRGQDTTAADTALLTGDSIQGRGPQIPS